MAESNPIQTLALVSTEVEESQTKLTLATQCIKAQEGLAHKLKKESERRREICNFMKRDNLQLEKEIRNVEQEMKSLTNAHEIIKSANVGLKKELLLCKKNNSDIKERVKNGNKKYEDLWLECKDRFESIPFIHKLLQATKKSETLKDDINILENEAKILQKEIKLKKKAIQEKDQKKIIELAEFFVKELPVRVKMIKEKSAEVEKLANEIEKISDEKTANSSRVSTVIKSMWKLNLQPPKEIVPQDDWPNLSKNNDSYFMMPQLRLTNTELEVISVKLDRIKKVDFQNTTPIKRTNSDTGLVERNKNKRPKCEQNLNDDYISPYFNKHAVIATNNEQIEQEYKTENFSKRKLVNILADVNLDINETYNIISKVNPDKLQEVNLISSDALNNKDCAEAEPKYNTAAPMEIDEIEEIDLTNHSQNILVPPSQFIDVKQEEKALRGLEQEVEVIVHMSMEDEPSRNRNFGQTKSSQESVKRVSFDLAMTVEEVTDDIVNEDVDKTDENAANVANETINSELDISSVTDDNYMRIKDMILKKHNLDLSPTFIYAKNNVVQKLQRNDDRIVTSKFFGQTKIEESEAVKLIVENKPNIDEAQSVQTSQMEQSSRPIARAEKNTIQDVAIEDANICSRKENGSGSPVVGFLFSHGPEGIPDTLDISMSTTVGEEGDDFPHCLDNSLLLSPKAVLPLASGDIAEVGSQDIPNFLSGFKKAGVSFFGQKPTTEANLESSEQNQENNFNFNFSRDKKKNKSGLFSFFR